MSYTEIFYWLTVADNAKSFFVTFVVIFTAISAIATLAYFLCIRTDSYDGQTDSDKEGQRMARKWMWWCYPFMILFWALYVFTPNRKEALLIVAGGQTLDFLSKDKAAKQIPHELSNFVLTELKSMAKDAEVDLNIKEQKNKVISEVKSMTGEQILEKMKTDSTFSKTMQGLIKDE